MARRASLASWENSLGSLPSWKVSGTILNSTSQDMSQKRESPLSLNVKVPASYLIISAVLGIAFTLLRLGPHNPEFEAKSFAFKLGAYSREYTLNIIFLISGIGILRRLTWARKFAIAVLLISTIYSAKAFASAFALASRSPSPHILHISSTYPPHLLRYLRYLERPLDLPSLQKAFLHVHPRRLMTMRRPLFLHARRKISRLTKWPVRVFLLSFNKR